ncbi:MAG: sulfotransferase domain-containing protein [Vicingaceae bacterium]
MQALLQNPYSIMVDFLIIGTPKAGTTSIQNYLSKHPEIFMPKQKEIHFFGKDLNNEKQLTKLDYHHFFKNSTSREIKGEASVFYLYSSSAFQEIYDYNPKMKLIVCFRNPVDFLISYHQDSIYVGIEEEPNFWKALDLETDRRNGKKIPKTNTFHESLYYSKMIDYAGEIKKFIELFGKENIHVVIFDEFFKDPKSQLKSMLKFLGTKDTDFIPELFNNKNPRRSLRNKKLNSFIKNPNSIFKVLVKVIIPFQSWRLKVSNFVRKANTTYTNVNTLSFEEKKVLSNRFNSLIIELENLFDLDLSDWKNKYL